MKFQSTLEELPLSSLSLFSLRESGWASACCEFLVSETADEASLSFSEMTVLWWLKGFEECWLLISLHLFSLRTIHLFSLNWLVAFSAYLVKSSGFRTVLPAIHHKYASRLCFFSETTHLPKQVLNPRRARPACPVPVLSASGAQPQKPFGL